MSNWITDRPPTEADADFDGDVAVKQRPDSDSFAYLNWTFIKPGTAWRRTAYRNAFEPAPKPAPEPAAPEPSASATQPRRFVSISRTILEDGDHILDAIDDAGVAWWIVGKTGWQQLSPLPARELPTEPAF